MALSRAIPDIARALVEAAIEAKNVPAVVHDVELIRESAEQNRGLWLDLQNSAIPLSDRQKALNAALKDEIQSLVLGALQILQEQGLLKNLEAFAESVREAALRLANHHEVRMTTATPVTAVMRKELEALLTKQLKGTVGLEEMIDPAVIGGIRLDIGDERIDATIQGTCKRLHQALYV